MISPFGFAAVSTLAFSLGVLGCVVLAALQRRRAAGPNGKGKGKGKGMPHDAMRPTRAQWHVYRALVATAGPQRCVVAGADFSDFVVFDLAGTPLLEVRYAATAPDAKARHSRAAPSPCQAQPLTTLRFDAHTTLGQIDERVAQALGDRIEPPWVDRPALLGAHLGSTWG